MPLSLVHQAINYQPRLSKAPDGILAHMIFFAVEEIDRGAWLPGLLAGGVLVGYCVGKFSAVGVGSVGWGGGVRRGC